MVIVQIQTFFECGYEQLPLTVIYFKALGSDLFYLFWRTNKQLENITVLAVGLGMSDNLRWFTAIYAPGLTTHLSVIAGM